MDLVELERLAMRISRARIQRKKIDQQLIRDTKVVAEMFKESKKKRASAGDYSIEVIPKTVSKVDMKRLNVLIEEGYIESDIVSSRKTDVVYIKPKADVRLEGNKFYG